MIGNIGQCPVCRQKISAYEPHDIDKGYDFHPHCWIKHAGIKISKLEKKLEKKTITMEEAQELQDCKEMLLKALSDLDMKPSPKKIIDKNPNLITRPDIRNDFSHKSLENTIQTQVLLREARWELEKRLEAQKQLNEPQGSDIIKDNKLVHIK